MTSSSVAMTAALCVVSRLRSDSSGPGLRIRPTA
jgi:hypothetical protein